MPLLRSTLTLLRADLAASDYPAVEILDSCLAALGCAVGVVAVAGLLVGVVG